MRAWTHHFASATAGDRCAHPCTPRPFRSAGWSASRYRPVCWIVIPHPVLVQAALGLEPLPRKPQRDRVAGLRHYSPKGRIARGPDLHPGGVRREGGAADVVDPHEVDYPVLDHRDRGQAVPDVFAQDVAGGLVIFRDAVAGGVEDRMDRTLVDAQRTMFQSRL
jgi:hypothetical protein